VIRRTYSFVLLASCALLVSFAFASDHKTIDQGRPSEFLKRIRAEQQIDVAMPAQSARLLSELVTKHSKSDKVTVTVKGEKDGLATLTIRGEQAHIVAVGQFVSLLKGELPTAEERWKQHDAMLLRNIKESAHHGQRK